MPVKPKIYINFEDIDGREILRKENIELFHLPRIGEAFDLIFKNFSDNEFFDNEKKLKGEIIVGEIKHVFNELSNIQSIIIVLFFKTDSRFKETK